jgi:hypothetical protein
MPHDQCPGSRRGHTWRERACQVPPSQGGLSKIELAEGRVCARCGVLGRINSQGVVMLVVTPAEVSTP